MKGYSVHSGGCDSVDTNEEALVVSPRTESSDMSFREPGNLGMARATASARERLNWSLLDLDQKHPLLSKEADPLIAF